MSDPFSATEPPGNWNPWSARPELAPRCESDGDTWTIRSGDGPGNHGGWDLQWHHVTPGEWRRFGVLCRAHDIQQFHDTVRAELIWWDEESQRLDWAHVRPQRLPQGAHVFVHEGPTPTGAVRATLRLALRWTLRGRIEWRDAFSEPIPEAKPRTVNMAVATGTFPGTSVEANVHFATDLIAQAARSQARVVCLPECITTWRTQLGVTQGARPMPGPETQILCNAARQHQIDVVCSMNESSRGLVYNTGLYIEAQKGLIATYRKVHLAVGERWRGVSPGDRFPVWDTSYGRVGMLICYDNVHAEGHRILSQKGAEVIFLPIMGDPRAVGDQAQTIWQTIMQMRAMDHHVWLVACRNRGEWGSVFRPDGKMVSSFDGAEGVVTAQIDLAFRHASWIGSNFENRYWGERRPHAYGELSQSSNS